MTFYDDLLTFLINHNVTIYFRNRVSKFYFHSPFLISLDFCEDGLIYKDNKCQSCGAGEYAIPGASTCSKCSANTTTIKYLPSSSSDCGMVFLFVTIPFSVNSFVQKNLILLEILTQSEIDAEWKKLIIISF